MTQSLLQLLKAMPTHSGASVYETLTPITLESEQVLFKQGSPSDSLYIVLSGELVCYVDTPQHEKKIIGNIYDDQAVGEMGLLSGEPRSLSVKAISPSKLLKLSKEQFDAFCRNDATFVTKLTMQIIARSRHVFTSSDVTKRQRKILLLPATGDIDLTGLLNKLLATRYGRESLHLVKRDEPQQYSPDSSTCLLFDARHSEISSLQIALPDMDTLLIIVQGDSRPQIPEAILSLLKHAKVFPKLKIDLLLLQPDTLAMPRRTRDWLSKARFNQHYHVRCERNSDINYLARVLSGRTNALVVGGGGAKGWAAVSALKLVYPLLESFDSFAGVSIGAIIVSCLLTTDSYPAFVKKYSYINKNLAKTITLLQSTFPIVSLFSGCAGTDATRRTFAALYLEDLWRPFVIVASNVNTRSEVHTSRGLLHEAIRMSAAVPGIIPPVVRNGEMIIDGALTNNLPTDIVRKQYGHKAMICALDLNGGEADKRKYNFPSVIPLKDSLLYKLKMAHNHYSFPGFFESFYNAITLGAGTKEDRNKGLADVLIQPNVHNIGLLNFSKRDQLIKEGELAGERVIDKLKEKLQ